MFSLLQRLFTPKIEKRAAETKKQADLKFAVALKRADRLIEQLAALESIILIRNAKNV